MKHVMTLTAATAIAALVSGVALSEGLGGITPPAPPPAPEQPPSPPVEATGGIVTSTNLGSIKAVFDAAGVPATIEKTSGGFNYVGSTLNGNFVATAPIDCENSDPNGKCGAIVILSGTWSTKVTPAQVNEYMQDFHLPTALLVGDGEPMLRYLFLVSDGVGPNFLEGNLVSFAYEMQSFGEFVAKSKTGPKSSFSVGGPSAEKAAKFGAGINLGEIAGPAAKGGKLSP